MTSLRVRGGTSNPRTRCFSGVMAAPTGTAGQLFHERSVKGSVAGRPRWLIARHMVMEPKMTVHASRMPTRMNTSTPQTEGAAIPNVEIQCFLALVSDKCRLVTLGAARRPADRSRCQRTDEEQRPGAQHARSLVVSVNPAAAGELMESGFVSFRTHPLGITNDINTKALPAARTTERRA